MKTLSCDDPDDKIAQSQVKAEIVVEQAKQAAEDSVDEPPWANWMLQKKIAVNKLLRTTNNDQSSVN